jgi:hypothetical protein
MTGVNGVRRLLLAFLLTVSFNAQRYVLGPFLGVLPIDRAAHIRRRQGRRQPVETNAAWRVMLELQRVACMTGARMYPISGTLLGLYRNGGILPHDVDIDVGVFADDPNLQAFIAALDASPFMQMRTDIRMKAGYPALNPWLPQLADGISCYKYYLRPPGATAGPAIEADVFLHFGSGGHQAHGISNRLWLNRDFDLVPASYGELATLVPRDVELYLAENYGDFRTPKTDFENLADCPNSTLLVGLSGIAYLLKMQRVYIIAGWSERLAELNRIYRSYRRQMLRGSAEAPLWEIRR